MFWSTVRKDPVDITKGLAEWWGLSLFEVSLESMLTLKKYFQPRPIEGRC